MCVSVTEIIFCSDLEKNKCLMFKKHKDSLKGALSDNKLKDRASKTSVSSHCAISSQPVSPTG